MDPVETPNGMEDVTLEMVVQADEPVEEGIVESVENMKQEDTIQRMGNEIPVQEPESVQFKYVIM